MTLHAADLLRKLAGVGAVGGAAASGCSSCAESGIQSIEGAGFDELLRAAQAGELSSGRGLTIAPGSGVELSADQLGRLGGAVDAAEAAGAQRLLAIVDGQAVSVDVATRTVLSGGEALRGAVVTDVDAVVVLPQGQGQEQGAGPGQAQSQALAPARALAGLDSVRNGSLAALLERSGLGASA